MSNKYLSIIFTYNKEIVGISTSHREIPISVAEKYQLKELMLGFCKNIEIKGSYDEESNSIRHEFLFSYATIKHTLTMSSNMRILIEKLLKEIQCQLL